MKLFNGSGNLQTRDPQLKILPGRFGLTFMSWKSIDLSRVRTVNLRSRHENVTSVDSLRKANLINIISREKQLPASGFKLWIYCFLRNVLLLHHPDSGVGTGLNLSLFLFGFPNFWFSSHHYYLCLYKSTTCTSSYFTT